MSSKVITVDITISNFSDNIEKVEIDKDKYNIEPKNKLITSYGILLFHKDLNGKIWYLLSQRRDTIEYSDYLKGRYSIYNLKNYFKLMSIDERERLKKYSFEELWNDLWIKHDHKFYKLWKHNAFVKYTLNYNLMLYLLTITTSNVIEPIWGFPKGRKNLNENDIQCSIREFKEETKLSIDYLNLLNIIPSKEIFKGSNDKMYSTVYFIAQVDDLLSFEKIKVNGIRTETISEEISNLKWCSLEEAIDILPHWRKKFLIETNYKIKEYFYG